MSAYEQSGCALLFSTWSLFFPLLELLSYFMCICNFCAIPNCSSLSQCLFLLLLSLRRILLAHELRFFSYRFCSAISPAMSVKRRRSHGRNGCGEYGPDAEANLCCRLYFCLMDSKNTIVYCMAHPTIWCMFYLVLLLCDRMLAFAMCEFLYFCCVQFVVIRLFRPMPMMYNHGRESLLSSMKCLFECNRILACTITSVRFKFATHKRTPQYVFVEYMSVVLGFSHITNGIINAGTVD